MSSVFLCFFFFQAEDGIRDAQESRGLGDVYKRQAIAPFIVIVTSILPVLKRLNISAATTPPAAAILAVSYTHLTLPTNREV